MSLWKIVTTRLNLVHDNFKFKLNLKQIADLNFVVGIRIFVQFYAKIHLRLVSYSTD